jgi:hypothetical protein
MQGEDEADILEAELIDQDIQNNRMDPTGSSRVSARLFPWWVTLVQAAFFSR